MCVFPYGTHPPLSQKPRQRDNMQAADVIELRMARGQMRVCVYSRRVFRKHVSVYCNE